MILDMNRSGAQIAWDYVHQSGPFQRVVNDIFAQFTQPNASTQPTQSNQLDQPTQPTRPWFIEDIADRDLWRWLIPDSKLVTDALFDGGFYYSIDSFDKLIRVANREQLIANIRIISAYKTRVINEICKRAIFTELTTVRDPTVKYRVWLLEADHTAASAAGNNLSADENCDFAAIWRYEFTKKEYYISLRASHNKDIDLSQVSKLFDEGGGHPKASGITLFVVRGQTLDSCFKVIDHPKGPDAKSFLYKSSKTV